MKKFIIDRVEEGFAVCECEDLSHISVPINNFPFEIKEGMTVILKNGVYECDADAEKELKSKILALHKKLMSEEDE